VLRAVARIAAQPTATWFADPYVNPYDRVASVVSAAESTGTLPVLVVYGIPERDCGGYSGGGAHSREQYLAWVGSLAAGIGQRLALVILEPDAVPQAIDGCLRATTSEDRQATLKAAVDILKALPATRVYLDAGNASWIDDPKVLADALVASGLNTADGFALNTANHESTDDSIAYAREISRHAASDHFVIDTSRNGAPITTRPNEWCNNPNASLGVPPSTRTEVPGLDALLWIKQPGDSDGECGRGEPPAGQWWMGYAVELAGD
jgi:endoglucanase